MKKRNSLVVKTTLLLVVAAGIFSCSSPKEGAPSMNVEQPDKIISVKQAKSMYDIYTKRKTPLLVKGEMEAGGVEEYNPTRYIEYSLDEMKQYVDYIESEAGKAGASVDNVRIYFGAYPETGNFSSGDAASYNRQSTIFIVPTTEIKGVQKGFYTTGAENKKERHLVFLEDDYKNLYTINGRRGPKANKGALFNTSMFMQDSIADDRSLILNDGSLVPPPKQDTDFGGN